jgi:hypothetical protein
MKLYATPYRIKGYDWRRVNFREGFQGIKRKESVLYFSVFSELLYLRYRPNNIKSIRTSC